MLVPVILAGGVGSRLWPLSREAYPKQFIPLFDGHSLFQNTLKRVANIPTVLAPIIVANEQHRFIIQEQLKSCGLDQYDMILEPCFKGTAPAVALAAVQALARYDQDVTLLVLSSDHLISDQAGFNKSVSEAVNAAQLGKLVTFGVKPTHPETGYGYIQVGHALSAGFEIRSFVEKPPVAKAAFYIEQPDYFWNSGTFLFSASTYLQEVLLHQPATYHAAKSAISSSKHDGVFIRPDAKAFANAEADSIDYAVMEKTTNGAMVALQSSWSDVGSWDALLNCSHKDDQNNAVHGDVLVEQSQNCYIRAESRLVVAVGLERLVIVETPDSVLVMHADQAQALKKSVSALKQQHRKEVTWHQRVHRPWGMFESIDAGERFQVKRITVAVGGRLSLQRHHHRSEHWVVVKGTARVTRDDESFLLSENQSTYIPIGVNHRLENVGKIPLEIIEVQSGAYLGEDDIVRLDDQYGRQVSQLERLAVD